MMVPARNLLRRQYHSYGACFNIDGGGGGGGGDLQLRYEYCYKGGAASLMAEEGEGEGERPGRDDDDEGGAGGGDGGNGDGWLRLGIGGGQQGSSAAVGREGLVELDLFSNRPSTAAAAAYGGEEVPQPPQPPMMMMGRGGFGFSWGYGQVGETTTVLGSSSSVAFEQPRRLAAPSEVAADWVLRRRPRPHVGIWFRLVASPNQSNEPYLPQITKSYLRIKDGRMTIRLLKKYLINKLELNNESEVEITCRGQQLHPLLTLQHIRDTIWRWSNGGAITVTSSLTDSPSLSDHHIMILHYSRSS